MSRRYLFKASVPNTYAAGIASLAIGWGGPTSFHTVIRTLGPQGEVAACECGLPKRKGSEGCFRCLSLDQLPANTMGRILEVLEDGEARTLVEIAAMAQRTTRPVLRYMPPLIESGRVRCWYEPSEPATRMMRPYGNAEERETLFAAGAKKVYRRTW